MARPKLECAVKRISLRLSLREGVDDDLIEFFGSIPSNRRAKAVTAALRLGGVNAIETAEDDVFSKDEENELLGALDEMEW